MFNENNKINKKKNHPKETNEEQEEKDLSTSMNYTIFFHADTKKNNCVYLRT